MANLTEVVVGVLGSLLAAEVVAYAPGITRWLVSRAVRKLPEKDQARFSEEWLAHADYLPGSISKLRHGLGCYLRAARSINRLRKFRSTAFERRAIAAILTVYVWTRFVPMHAQAIARLVRQRKWRSTQAYLIANRILLKTLILETVYRGHEGAEVIAALEACSKEIREILQIKTGK